MTSTYHLSACPHDCPSVCALEVERLDAQTIGKVRGAKANGYTAGVICAKVARYAERAHHPDRLRTPLRRTDAKGAGGFQPIGWDDALDEVAEGFLREEQKHGPEGVWPYHSGGTLGLVQRYGMERLRHVKRYSGWIGNICVTPGNSGWLAGVGGMLGPDPREMGESDLIVVWGTNAVATQVQVMTHVARARRERNAKLVVIDAYRTATAEKADMSLILRPGTDGALACAVMHVLLKEGLADREFLARHSDFSPALEAHLAEGSPAWAARITGLSEAEIVAFARLYGATPRSFIRVGYGFSRSRNGAANVHAVSCLPTLTNAWRHRGGGAFLASIDIWGLDNTLIQGLDAKDGGVRTLEQCRIGAILTGDPDALRDGPPVAAMLIQNGNPAVVSPDSGAVRRGLAREDLFLCVHEQFMTATAAYADIVLPATTFLEHDDMYMGWGQTHLVMGPKVIEPFAEARSNHEVICGLAGRLGASHPGFRMTAWELLDATLKASGHPDAETVKEQGWIDCAPNFATAHFAEGFPTSDGRFHFLPDWSAVGPYHEAMARLPDHVELVEQAGGEHPFRLVSPPARSFLNTSFTETATSREREGSPTVLLHPEDAEAAGVADGGAVRLGNRRGSLLLSARCFAGVQRGVLVVEGLWPNDAFGDGFGINLLVGADPVPPAGGAAFHDTAVWLRPA
jgi:anaerobic selenocysteine-containing dehydrogenase